MTDLPLAVAVAQGVLIFVPFDLIKTPSALVAVAAAPAIAPSRVWRWARETTRAGTITHGWWTRGRLLHVEQGSGRQPR